MIIRQKIKTIDFIAGRCFWEIHATVFSFNTFGYISYKGVPSLHFSFHSRKELRALLKNKRCLEAVAAFIGQNGGVKE
jgi:hypothetical protein